MNLIITGTSGVGKSFLEEELQKTGKFYPLPKYTDRSLRPGEDPSKIISLTNLIFQKLTSQNKFFFTLSYSGHNYGWAKEDLNKFKNKFATLAVTLDSLFDFFKTDQSFLPILLDISIKDLSLLKKRLSLRGDNPDQIKARLSLARNEINNIQKYKTLVRKHHGLIFNITDNQTIFNEVIPKVTSLPSVQNLPV